MTMETSKLFTPGLGLVSDRIISLSKMESYDYRQTTQPRLSE